MPITAGATLLLQRDRNQTVHDTIVYPTYSEPKRERPAAKPHIWAGRGFGV